MECQTCCIPSPTENIQKICNLSERLPEQKSTEWLEYRKSHITSTDVGTIMHGRQSDIWGLVEKKGGKPQTFFGNEATRHGEKWEDTAIEKFEKLYKVKAILVNMIEHKTDKRFIFSPDAILKDGSIIEVKCPFSRKINGSVSQQYICQVQMGMEIIVDDLNKE